MNNQFDNIINRQDSDSIKWHFFDPDVLPLWVADMDFISPQPVIEALQNRVRHGVFGYPVDSKGLIGAAVDWVKNRHGWLITPEQVVIIPSLVAGFNLAARAFCNGRPLIMQTPAYPPFFQVAAHAGVERVLNVIQSSANGYELDLDDFEKSASRGAGVFLLCNPHNPTGRVFSRDELERLAQICLAYHITICSDEIHSDLVYPGQKHIPIASLSPEIAESTVTLIAPSKTFNIAGLCTALAIIPSAEKRKQFLEADPGLIGHANVLGQTAAEAAYRHGQPWLDELIPYLEANRNYLVDFIRRELPEISVFSPQGTYLAWLNCQGLDLPGGNPAQFFKTKAKVGFNYGGDFGPGFEQYVRINFGCPRSVLVESLNRMKLGIGQKRINK